MMKIKNKPESRLTFLGCLKKGDCFMLLEDVDDCPDIEGDEHNWEREDIFMVCGCTNVAEIPVVNLEFSTVCKFDKNIPVEKIEVSIECE